MNRVLNPVFLQHKEMKKITVNIREVSRSFAGSGVVFHNINSVFRSGSISGITGSNGSGKTTLLKIMAGIIKPTAGKITYMADDIEIPGGEWKRHIGFVSPYFNLYEEFTPVELTKIMAEIRGLGFDKKRARFLLEFFGLYENRSRLVRTFSSGMKQRMKYIISLYHQPPVLMLDEPSTNLDKKGFQAVKDYISAHIGQNGLVVIAGNDDREISLADNVINIEDHKGK